MGKGFWVDVFQVPEFDLPFGPDEGGRQWQLHGDYFVVGYTQTIYLEIIYWDSVGDDQIKSVSFFVCFLFDMLFEVEVVQYVNMNIYITENKNGVGGCAE